MCCSDLQFAGIHAGPSCTGTAVSRGAHQYIHCLPVAVRSRPVPGVSNLLPFLRAKDPARQKHPGAGYYPSPCHAILRSWCGQGGTTHNVHGAWSGDPLPSPFLFHLDGDLLSAHVPHIHPPVVRTIPQGGQRQTDLSQVPARRFSCPCCHRGVDHPGQLPVSSPRLRPGPGLRENHLLPVQPHESYPGLCGANLPGGGDQSGLVHSHSQVPARRHPGPSRRHSPSAPAARHLRSYVYNHR